MNIVSFIEKGGAHPVVAPLLKRLALTELHKPVPQTVGELLTDLAALQSTMTLAGLLSMFEEQPQRQ